MTATNMSSGILTPGQAEITGRTERPAISRRRRGASPWAQFVVKRAGGLVGSLVVLVLVTFLMVQVIPGDPAVGAAGPDASLEKIAAVRAELGLDQPVLVQFVDYVASLFSGTMGRSFSLNASVGEIIAIRLPFTAGLAAASIVVVLLIAVPLGMLVGILTRGGRRRWLDNGFSVVTSLVSAIPAYVLATLLVVLFAVTLAVLPPAYTRANPAASFVLPIAAMSIGAICTVARVVRRECAIVLEQDYLRTARGWRLRPLLMHARYTLPNLLTSTLTLAGLILSGMLGGSIIVETVFGWPGLGIALVQAIANKDYPLIQGIILVVGMLAAVLTVLIDAVLGILDPRTLGARHA